MWYGASLTLLSRFSVFVSHLYYNVSACGFLAFITLGVCWGWMCRLMTFIKFGKFSAIISSNIFPPSLSPLLWHSHYAQVGTFVLNISESLFYLIPFPFCYSDGWSQLLLQVFWFSLLPDQTCCWALVLVSSGCQNSIPYTRRHNQQKFIFWVLKARNPTSRHQPIWFLVRTLFLAWRWSPSDRVLTWQRGKVRILMSSLTRTHYRT